MHRFYGPKKYTYMIYNILYGAFTIHTYIAKYIHNPPIDPELLGFSICQTLSEKAIEGQQIFTTKQAKWMGRKKKKNKLLTFPSKNGVKFQGVAK